MHRDDIDWVFDCVEWYLEQIGGGGASWCTFGTLTEPTDEHFPVDLQLSDVDLANDFLGFVREHANLKEGFEGLRVTAEEPPECTMPIPYDVHRTEPMDVVAYVARGAAHYLAHEWTRRPPPHEAMEEAIDVTTVFLSFGVFACNSCFERRHVDLNVVRRWPGGWLHELDADLLVLAFAINNELLGIDSARPLPHLLPGARRLYKKQRRLLRRRFADRVDALREVPDAWAADGPYR